MTLVYGYPQHHLQKQLQKEIYCLNKDSTDPWLIIGDFK